MKNINNDERLQILLESLNITPDDIDEINDLVDLLMKKEYNQGYKDAQRGTWEDYM